MSYKFEPGKQYRMPTDFGPDLGPRQGPDEKVFECLDNPKSTSISVSSTTNEVELSALLPEGFELAEPVATVTL
ncbi:MAG: hypothetical protein VX910_01060, partial [Candidatus Latescibacterota bacterium]|nr:hypothetical protein [Candidatus Latescibacterota bacterium]